MLIVDLKGELLKRLWNQVEQNDLEPAEVTKHADRNQGFESSGLSHLKRWVAQAFLPVRAQTEMSVPPDIEAVTKHSAHVSQFASYRDALVASP